jgi:hypothetical protein
VIQLRRCEQVQVRPLLDRYPQVLAAFSDSSPSAGRDDALHFGIDRILDGLAVLIAARSA